MNNDESENKTRLDDFFAMFDAVEDDIDELISDENEEPLEIGGYECLLITFSNLRLYCNNAGIPLKQIEDQHKELKQSQANSEPGTAPTLEELNKNDEVVNFCKLLEQVEDSFSALETRHEKSGEGFDEWTCVLVMYSHLRDYCEKEGVDYKKLQEEITHLHSEMEKNSKS
jgi:hypothetical protein